MRGTVLIGLAALTAPYMAEAATCSAAWGQCGGSGWTGPTCCVDGYDCSEPYAGASSYYLQCMPSKTTKPTSAPTSSGPAPTSPPAYLTYDTSPPVPAHDQVYPAVSGNPCPYKLEDNVCCAYYCASNNQSEKCDGCSGSCVSPPSADCKSGTMWGEQTTVSDTEDWHYSRSTHYGTTNAGACAFGLYAMCTKGSKTANWTDPMLAGTDCDAFCKAYPALCQDPKDITLRGNFAAPNGDYYTQFWPHLVGDRDNYLSCGECFEMVHTKKDGTDYKPGEAGYTDPIVLEVTDSCPCHVNSKWCCGSGDDHCGEVGDFKYGCPIPKGSHHMDLSDIAMGRLQGNGIMTDGVIPTRYKRVPCPKPGNVYLWLQDSAGPYYFAISVVNAAGVGSVTKLEVKGAGMTDWLPLIHSGDYPSAHPQERYGSWVIPKDKGPIYAPLAMRITSPNGEQLVNEQAIKSYTPPANAIKNAYYIDFGAQFSMYGKH